MLKMLFINLLALMMFSLNEATCRVSSVTGKVFSRGNLVAWCIVPFDNKKRSPEERAQMLVKLGITKFAYFFIHRGIY